MKKNKTESLKTLAMKGLSPMGGGAVSSDASLFWDFCEKLNNNFSNFAPLAKSLLIISGFSLSFAQSAAADVPVPINTDIYTLVETSAPSNETITSWEWNETEQKLVPAYYRIKFTDKTLGSGNQTGYLSWSEESDKRMNLDLSMSVPKGDNYLAFKYDVDDIDLIEVMPGEERGKIEKDFYGISSPNSCITNEGSIESITGNFIYNNLQINGRENPRGTAIFNAGEIGSINGTFLGNTAFVHPDTSWRQAPLGGAIYNSGLIKSLKGDFINNRTITDSHKSFGGAIYNEAVIDSIQANFIGNSAISEDGGYEASGGAIWNSEFNSGLMSSIGEIKGNFYKNSAIAYSDSASGGAIYNYSDAFEIAFLSEDGTGGSDATTINSIYGNFTENTALSYGSSAQGGAIYNSAKIGEINGDFIKNSAVSKGDARYRFARGGAIVNDYGTIGQIKGNFIENSAVSNYDAYGGAIYYSYNRDDSVSYSIDGSLDGSLNITNSSFINNTAESATGTAQGGAIYSTKNMNIYAENNGMSVFSGNKTVSNGIETRNAIFMSSDNLEYNYTVDGDKVTIDPIPLSLTLSASTNGTILFDDTIAGDKVSVVTGSLKLSDNLKDEGVSTIDGYLKYTRNQGWYDESTPDSVILEDGLKFGDLEVVDATESASASYSLKLTGDPTGQIYLNNDIINANITLDNTTLHLGKENILNQSQSLTLNSGSISMLNNSTGSLHIPTLNLNGSTNLSVDVDLARQNMDKITANSYNINENASLNVQNLNLLNDATQDKTTIQFAPSEYAQNVHYTGPSPIAYSPIYKYNVSYSQNPENNLGYFIFDRSSAGNSSGNPSDNFNPAVLAPSVATQAGAYSTQLQTFNYAFQHSDNFMNIPYLERIALKYQNKYSLSPTADATDIGTFSPLFTKNESQAFWIKPYASFENIPLNNGPKVSNINYGTLIGHDSDLTPIKHGFERVLTSYIGYNGASQRFSGVDAYQNGALIGGTATLYKNNFFNATTISVGASAGNSNNMYGSENYTMLLAGIANKTGYNLEFKNGKFILQPSLLLSYTFVNTFDYRNAAGVKIESDALHAIQLAPSLKFIANTNSGWQPYLAVSMIWNILDKSHVTANDVRLPSMSIDPYIAYGAGIQKRFNNEKYTAFAQTMIHNGGRNGISLTAGLRWHLGKDN